MGVRPNGFRPKKWALDELGALWLTSLLLQPAVAKVYLLLGGSYCRREVSGIRLGDDTLKKEGSKSTSRDSVNRLLSYPFQQMPVLTKVRYHCYLIVNSKGLSARSRGSSRRGCFNCYAR